jgi:hypothetical protein
MHVVPPSTMLFRAVQSWAARAAAEAKAREVVTKLKQMKLKSADSLLALPTA